MHLVWYLIIFLLFMFYNECPELTFLLITHSMKKLVKQAWNVSSMSQRVLEKVKKEGMKV